MSASVITAIITGTFSLIGTVSAVFASNNRILRELDKHNAVQDEQITDLTREVRRHNNFAERVPVLEEKVDSLVDRVKRLEGNT